MDTAGILSAQCFKSVLNLLSQDEFTLYLLQYKSSILIVISCRSKEKRATALPLKAKTTRSPQRRSPSSLPMHGMKLVVYGEGLFFLTSVR